MKCSERNGAPLACRHFELHLERDVATNASIKPDGDAAPASRQADHLHISPTILPAGVQADRSDAQVKVRYYAERSEQPVASHSPARVPKRTKKHGHT